MVCIDSGVCTVLVGRPDIQPLSPTLQLDRTIEHRVLIDSRQNIPGYRDGGVLYLSIAGENSGVCTCILQWNLSIKDTLGPTNSSTVERLSTLQR